MKDSIYTTGKFVIVSLIFFIGFSQQADSMQPSRSGHLNEETKGLMLRSLPQAKQSYVGALTELPALDPSHYRSASIRRYQQGIELGNKQATFRVATKMMARNCSVDDIMDCTELSRDEIEALKEEIALRKTIQDWSFNRDSSLHTLLTELFERAPTILRSSLKKVNLDMLPESIDDLVQMQNENAMEWKIDGLIHGTYGFTQNLDEAHNLIEAQIVLGSGAALRWKIKGLTNGMYKYPLDSNEALRLIEQSIPLGNEESIEQKIQGLTNGKSGYSLNLQETRHFIEEQVAQGSETAIGYKIEGLLNGMYGYAQNMEEADHFIEEQVAQGSETAIRYKISSLTNGMYGHAPDLEGAYHFIEEQIALGSEEAIGYKLQGLLLGSYVYRQDPVEVISFLKKILQMTTTVGSISKSLQAILKESFRIKVPILPSLIRKLIS